MVNQEQKNDSVKDLEFDGYKFTVNTELMDDVDAFEIIDRIENKRQTAAIVPLLHFLIGTDGYNSMKEYFVKKDGKFSMTKLAKVYEVIAASFNPKG